MKTLTLCALLTLVPACLPTPTPRAPEGPSVPIVSATEEQDEWLYENCKFLGLLDTTSVAGPFEAASRGASMGELVYENGLVWNVSLFSCRPNPTWAGGENVAATGEAAKPSGGAVDAAKATGDGVKPKSSPPAGAKWL